VLEGAGTPEIDPVLRAEVRTKLREKRREPYTREFGQGILGQLQDDRWA
jgi:hypothetical protein